MRYKTATQRKKQKQNQQQQQKNPKNKRIARRKTARSAVKRGNCIKNWKKKSGKAKKKGGRKKRTG